ncbi:MAG: peptidoglycan-binding protein [Solirubrobacteraceae bacterium]
MLAAAVVVIIVATSSNGPTNVASPTVAAGAATVQRRNLVTSEEETGTISYTGSSTISSGLAGTLTWVPSIGRVINPGQRLFDVDNFPVILMNGSVPAYRALDSSDSAGPDIQQLNANLIELGFDSEWVNDDDEWQAATTAGVEAFQKANGEPETGSLTLGDIVFLRGAQRVASLQGAATTVSYTPDEGHAEFVAADATPTQSLAGAERTVARADKTISALKKEARKLQQQDGRAQQQERLLEKKLAAAQSRAQNAEPASGGGSPVMTTTSTNLVVAVDLTAGEQGVTRVGRRVPVVLPSGATVHGHVVRIGQVATSSSGSSKVPITIRLDKHENGRGLDQATVNVTFVEKTARNVLSVPVTALLARPGGGYAVQEATTPHKLIDVTIGAFATGYVQIAGSGVHPGLRVTDARG